MVDVLVTILVTVIVLDVAGPKLPAVTRMMSVLVRICLIVIVFDVADLKSANSHIVDGQQPA